MSDLTDALKLIVYRCPSGSSASLGALRLLNAPDSPTAQVRYIQILQQAFSSGSEFNDEEREILSGVIEGAPRLGRPTTFDQPMKQFNLFLRADQITWLRDQERGAGETIRALIDAAMK